MNIKTTLAAAAVGTALVLTGAACSNDEEPTAKPTPTPTTQEKPKPEPAPEPDPVVEEGFEPYEGDDGNNQEYAEDDLTEYEGSVTSPEGRRVEWPSGMVAEFKSATKLPDENNADGPVPGETAVVVKTTLSYEGPDPMPFEFYENPNTMYSLSYGPEMYEADRVTLYDEGVGEPSQLPQQLSPEGEPFDFYHTYSVPDEYLDSMMLDVLFTEVDITSFRFTDISLED